MHEQAIPFITILILWIINMILKRKIICISNMVFAYYFFCFGGAIFVHLNPRTGFPFADQDAMCYLAKAVVFLLLPLLFMKDARCTPNELRFDFEALDRQRKKVWLLFFLLLYSEICFSPNLFRFFNFLSLSMDREEFRLGIDRSLRGNIILSLAAFFLCFAKPALFFCICYLLFGRTPEHKKIAAAMAVASLAYPMWSLQQIDRREIGKIIFMGVSLFLVFYHYFDPEKRKITLRFLCVFLGLLMIPFLILSIVRYQDDWIYQLLQYFAAGPYYFNADYVANTECELPLFAGNYCFPLLAKPIHAIIGVSVDLAPEEMWKYPELYHKIYWRISQCHPFEFKTMVGCYLLDFTPETTMVILSGTGVILSLFFFLKKYDLSYLFFMSIYAFALLFGTIMFAFASFIFNIEMIMLTLFGFAMQFFIDRERKHLQTDTGTTNIRQSGGAATDNTPESVQP